MGAIKQRWFLAWALACAATARAEDEPNSTKQPTVEALGEILVTARRREEGVGRVPIAVTVLTNRQLHDEQITDINRLQFAVPSLGVWPVIGNSMTASVSLRGLFEPDPLPTVDATVGTYLDGVYIARITGANLEMVDLKRAEVLRGPQGTLFGRNTIGGAINLVPNPPVRRFEASVDAAAGNYASVDLTGVLNVPIHLLDGAMRLAVNHQQHRGYGRAVRLGQDLNDDNIDFVRAQLALAPSREWTIDLSADLTSDRSGGQLVTFVAGFEDAEEVPIAAGNPTDDLDNYRNLEGGDVQSNRAGRFDARVWGTSAVLTGRLPHATFKSISAYRRLDLDFSNADMDGTPYDLFAILERQQNEYQVSEELQAFDPNTDDGFDWTAGLVLFRESARFSTHNANLSPPNETEGLTRATAQSESVAAYVQVTREITPRARLTAGIRYNVDWRQLTSRNGFVLGGVEYCRLDDSILDAPGSCQATLPWRRFGYLPWTVGIDLRANTDAMYYAKISRGYRAGGYNMRGGTPVGLLTFGPENVLSYEAGAKVNLAGGQLHADLALYYSDYNDIQIGEVVPDPIQDVTFIRQNGGRARIQGVELELTALLGPLRLSGSLGVADGKYLELDPATGASLDDGIGLPKTTVSLSGDLPFDTSLGRLNIHADYDWRTDDGDHTFLARCRCRTEFALLNATIVLALASGNSEVGLWGHNITNRHYMAQWVDFDSFIDDMPGDPRTYGVSVTYRFGG